MEHEDGEWARSKKKKTGMAKGFAGIGLSISHMLYVHTRSQRKQSSDACLGSVRDSNPSVIHVRSMRYAVNDLTTQGKVP